MFLGMLKAIAALVQSQCGWPGWVPASPLQARGQRGNNSPLGLHMFLLSQLESPRDLCHQKLHL